MIGTEKSNIEHTNGHWELPNEWKWATIGEICTVNPARPKLKREEHTPTSFIPMANINETDGVISQIEVRPYSEVARGFTYFEENDVLFAKITPSMQNGKCAIAYGLRDGLGFGSTEFHVLRPGSQVTSGWLYYYLRRLQFRFEAMEHFSGAVGQQRVPEDFLKFSLIPIPDSIEMQNRITGRIEALLVNLSKANKTLVQMQSDLDQIMDAVLAEIFDGTITTNWSNKISLGNLVQITARQVDPKLASYRQLPHIGVDSILSAQGRLGTYHTVEEDGISSGNYLFEPGMVLYSKIRPYLRKAVQVDFKGLCSADIYPLTVVSDQLLPGFLVWSLLASPFTEFTNAKSGRARIPKINREELFAYKFPFPDSQEQQYIINYINSIQDYVDAMQTVLKGNKTLLQQVEQAILNESFKGEV